MVVECRIWVYYPYELARSSPSISVLNLGARWWDLTVIYGALIINMRAQIHIHMHG